GGGGGAWRGVRVAAQRGARPVRRGGGVAVPAPQAADATGGGATAAARGVGDVVATAAEGDLEVRVPALDGGPEVQRLRTGVNRLLDVMDAFVRESQDRKSVVEG